MQSIGIWRVKHRAPCIVFFWIMDIDFSNQYGDYICADLYDANGNFMMRQTELLVAAKYFEWLKPDIQVQLSDCEGGVEIEVSSDVFAKRVCIDFDAYDCVLSDNFFDITDRNAYKIKAQTEHTAEELRKSMQILSVYDIGR